MPKSSSSEEPSSSASHTRKTEKTACKSYLLSSLSALINKILKMLGKYPSSKLINLEQARIGHALNKEEILQNFLTFNNKIAEDAMIPRSDIVAVKHDITLEELLQVIAKTHHTRTLVYEVNLDNIIGFVHIKDIFMVLAEKQFFQLKQIIRKPIISVPSMKLTDLLVTMQRQRTHIAVVVDEYGGTDGIVTIEDIMEEIVGRIEDEHDSKLESDSYQIIDDRTILSSSRVEVENLEKILGVKLKEDKGEFDTIGGLVLTKIGHVPLTGTIIEISDQVELEVIDANSRTLKQVKLTLKNQAVLQSDE